MKNFYRIISISLISFLTLISISANAHLCESTLVDHHGNELERFIGQGREINAACRSASAQCKQALARRGGQQLMCRLHRNTRTPNPTIKSCQSVMKDRFNQVVNYYQSRSRNYSQACRQSLIICQQEVKRMRDIGTFWGEYCQIQNGRIQPPRPPRRDWVTRSCRVNRFGPRGLVQSHIGYSSGYRGTGVQTQACHQAMSQCNYSRMPLELCVR